MELITKGCILIIGLVSGYLFNTFIEIVPKYEDNTYVDGDYRNKEKKLKIIDLVLTSKNLINTGKKRYLLVAIITGVIFILIYNKYMMTFRTIYYLLLVSLLIIITFIDIDHFIIPDKIIVVGIIIALLFNIFEFGISIVDSILGAVISGLGTLLVIYLIEFITKKECMGGGDIKLFAMTGLFLGIKGGILTIILSIYVGAIYGIITIIYSKVNNNKQYKSMIPYGPFISIAALITILWGNRIIDWYLAMLIWYATTYKKRNLYDFFFYLI